MCSFFKGLPHPQKRKVPKINGFFYCPKDHWTLKTGYFEDHTPAIQVQTLPLEGPRSLGWGVISLTLSAGEFFGPRIY